MSNKTTAQPADVDLVQFDLDVPKELYDKLKVIADKQGVTVDELASRAVAEAISNGQL